jgi:putative ATP-dependent endonuclease of the OLD family
MKLARLRVRNFRCFKDEIALDIDNLTAIIGRNDAGKSSLMDALEIFFNDTLPDKHDASKGGNAKDLTIVCEFEDLPSEIVIDDSNPTTLIAEWLLAPTGRLEIHKTFNAQLEKPKCTNVAAYCAHPTATGADDLLQLKNADLKKRAKELGVDLTGIDVKLNAPIRDRIRQSIPDLKPLPTLIALNEDNGKNVWDALRSQLPAFALFKSDRASTDQDPEAQDPLKAAVKEAIKEKEAELAAIIQHVEATVRRVAERTVEKVREMDPTLAKRLNPQFGPPKWDTLFKASITGDDDIPINKRGSGVRRLLLLNFFRAKAELSALGRGVGVIYAIEEPETSQHPHNQRLLMRAFSDLSTSAQVIVTTHTPTLARVIQDSSLRFVDIQSDSSRQVLTGGAANNPRLAQSLGVLPDNSVQLFVGVEGPNDIAFLRNISRVLATSGAPVPDLDKMELDGRLIFFPLGGSSLAYWVRRLEPLNRPEFHLFDRDNPPPAPPKCQAEVDAINNRPRCSACITNRRETENYIHWKAINEAYARNGLPLGLAAGFGDFADVPAEVARAVYAAAQGPGAWAALSTDEMKKKVSQAKSVLNTQATMLMTRELLAECDPSSEVLSWFAQMKRLVEDAEAVIGSHV